jgi:hypothetical protein
MKKVWRILLLFTIGCCLNYTLIWNSDNEIIFDGLVLFFLILIYLSVFAWVIYQDNKEFRKLATKNSFLPSFVGILFVIAFFIISYLLAARDKSPILIQAGYDGGYNGCWFEFRKDGSYKFVNSGGIGATIYRGNYIINDTIIALSEPNIDNVINTKYLAIRRGVSFKSSTNQMLYQINDKHEIIDPNFVFTINMDNRKK